MTATTLSETLVQDRRPCKKAVIDLCDPELLAKWPMVGLILFIFGVLVFGGLSYNLLAQGPLLAWDKLIANTLPAIGLKSPSYVKTIMDAGFYIGKEVIMIL